MCDVLTLGWPILLVAGGAAVGGIAGTIALGRLLGVQAGTSVLLATGLDRIAAGAWAGASVHAVGQVLVVAGILGAAALEIAGILKLLRVLVLTPVFAVSAWHSHGPSPPLFPAVVLAFNGVILVRSLVPMDPLPLGSGRRSWGPSRGLPAALFAGSRHPCQPVSASRHNRSSGHGLGAESAVG